jgi:DNA polymerase-4
MGSVHAQRLCPDVVFLPGNFPLYQEVSTDVHAIFHSVTPYVEGLALDEAFLDVTGSLKIFGTAKDIAHLIRERITTEIGIPCSVGIATNKFIAKIASKAAKPIATAEGVREGKGVVQVVSGSELSFLHPLPMKSLWGVGPVTQEKLDRIGMKTIGDLAALPLHVLTVAVGEAHGRHLHDLSHGRDDRPVESERDVKSIGHEETFNEDLFTYEEVHRHLVRLCDAVASRLRAHHTLARTLTLKVKFSDFHSITRSITAGGGKSSGPSLVDALTPLLKNINLAPGVRLLGVSTSNFTDERAQPSLFDEDQVRDDSWDQASEAIDHIRENFGKGAIRPGSAL